jgi:AcrR family transcriptional regulator
MTKAKAIKPRLGRPPATDSADTRRRILDLARQAFATLGYEAATNRNIGAEANLTAGALYYYFGSKLDLYIAVYDDAQERVYAQFTSALSGPTTFRGKFEAVLEAAHEMNKQDPSLARFLGAMRVDARRNPEPGAALKHTSARRESFFDQIVDVGVETGRDRSIAARSGQRNGADRAGRAHRRRVRRSLSPPSRHRCDQGIARGQLIRPAP